MNAEPFLRVRGLSKSYGIHNVSLDLEKGSTLGLIGVSGSGKSTLARCLAGFDTAESGEILLEGRSQWPRQEVQLILQQPAASLNPRFTAEEIVAEPLRIQRRGDAPWRARRARELMATVGLDPAAACSGALEFSGGERQRLAIARALALEPKLLILDESLASLDLSVQAQIANLLLDLQEQRGLTYILISHDVALVGRIASEIAVMDRGAIVERRAA
ncbi:ABC transporter related [Candidatus Sulfopaludibacter sp. SbA3]|nr:ABC transporter related [Candidatus Sulfopaludibacter sp. SbA3]